MSVPVRILILEDQADDAELMVFELRRAGFDPAWQRVDTEAAYIAALETSCDVILADYTLPAYDALRAMRELDPRGLDIPFIVVSGSLSEEEAIILTEQGATDYLLKDRLARLGPAVKRALSEKKLRDEKLHAEIALRRSEIEYRALFESNPLPMWVYDRETLAFLAVNEAAVHHYGYSRDEFLRMSLNDLRPPDDISSPIASVPQASGLSVRQHCKKDGTRILVEISANDILFNSQPARLVLANDITERQRIAAAERDQRILAEALRNATAALNSTLELEDILDTLFTHVQRVIPYDAASIMMLEGGIARVTSCRGFSKYGSEADVLGFTIPIEQLPYNVEIMVTGQPAIVFDTVSDPKWTTVPQSRWIRSHLSASIRTGEQTLGFLNLDSAKSHTFTPTQAEWLQAFADQAAIAIRNAQLLQAARHHNAELEALRQASLDSISQLELQPVLESILFHTSRLLDADDTHIFLYDGQHLSFGAAFGEEGVRLEPVAQPRPDGITYQVARTGKSIAIADVNRHALFQNWQWGGSIVALPLRVGSRVNGVMNLAFKQPRDFPEHELDILELFADQAALAIENAQLYQHVQQYSETLEQRIVERTAQLLEVKDRQETIITGLQTLIASTTELIACADVDALFRHAVEIAREKLGLERCAIYVRDGDFLQGTYGTDRKGRLTNEYANRLSIRDARWQERLRLFLPEHERWITIEDKHFEWDGEKAVQIGAGWVAITPILGDGEFAGVVFNDTAISGAALDEVRQEIVAIYCLTLGNILQRKRAEEALKASEQNTRIQNRVLSALLTSNDEAMYSGTLNTIRDIFESESGFFGYMNDVEDLVCPSITRDMWPMYNYSGDTVVFPRASWGGLWGQILREKRSLIENEPHHVSGEHLPINRSMGAPILYQGEVIGLIYIADHDRDYTEQERLVLERLCAILAPVLKARLERNREEAIRIEAEKQIIQLNRVLEQHAIELQEALKREKELGELKARFTSMVSHEFRTPLAMILSSSDLLRSFGHRMQDEQKHQHFETIQINIQHLNELLNDVLLIGQAQTVGLTVNPVRLDLVPLCRSLVREIQLLGGSHEIVFTSQEDSLYADMDEKLIRRLVTNLLTNAVKYSHADGKVKVDLARDGDTATLRIEDEGIGIPEKDRERLFEIFHRASNVGNISGTGLGLMIVKHAVEAHRGTIDLDSKEGVGTTFTIRLPLRQESILAANR